jgi:copper chaperone NosL
MMRQFGYAAIILCYVSACTPAPQEIVYGEDACHSCLMTIVDTRHAAQLVTKKGRAYKFDAIECMVEYLNKSEPTEYAYLLVSDYDNGKLIDAETATYLISPAIPSPMGAFLSAFDEHERAHTLQKSQEGQLYTWKDLSEGLNSR